MLVRWQVDPRILVVTLEIVDMHEAFQKQKVAQARERALKYVHACMLAWHSMAPALDQASPRP